MITSKPARLNGLRTTFLYRSLVFAGKYFCGDSVYTDLTWTEDMATQGCDQSADPAAGTARAA